MKNEQNRKDIRIGLGALMTLAVVMLWVGVAQGAPFQPVPNQSFGIHWGMSVEDAQKVRTLEKKDEIGKHAIYHDKSLTMQEMPGVTTVLYLAMNGRIGGAFIGLHCEKDVLRFMQAFVVIYGMPNAADKEAMAVEWRHAGNIMQVDMQYNMITVGNRVIIESAEGVLDKMMPEKDPAPGNGPPVVKPGPRT